MSKQLQFAVLLSIAFACSTRPAMADTTVEVTGLVIAPDDSVVPNASVEAVRLPGDNDDLSAGQLRWIQADNEGRFRLTLPPGRYEIRAKHETDGYPDPNFMLSTDPHSDFPVISVDSRDLSGIRVKLGERGGILEGELLDKASRSPVEKGKVTIADARKPDVFVEVFADKEGRFQFAVPDKPIKVSGSARGYRAARFQGEVTLARGERRKIILELVPQ